MIRPHHDGRGEMVPRSGGGGGGGNGAGMAMLAPQQSAFAKQQRAADYARLLQDITLLQTNLRNTEAARHTLKAENAALQEDVAAVCAWDGGCRKPRATAQTQCTDSTNHTNTLCLQLKTDLNRQKAKCDDLRKQWHEASKQKVWINSGTCMWSSLASP